MKKVTVYCGETIQEKCGKQLHPVQDVEFAKKLIESDKDEVAYSNSPDFVSAIKYIGLKQGVETVFFLNEINYGNDIDPIFEDFNRSLDMVSELSK